MKRVKIISAKKDDWYHSQIGSIFNVDECTGDYCLSGIIGAPWINIRDCEIIEESKPQPEPFDLERAKAGDPVITFNGKCAKYISTISKGRTEPMHIFEVTTGPKDDSSWPYCYASNGCYQFGDGLFNQNTSDDPTKDLFMAPKEPEFHEAWVNSSPWGYSATLFSTEEEAKKRLHTNQITIKIRFPKP